MKCNCGWCAFCQDIQVGDEVERDGKIYEVFSIDPDGKSMDIIDETGDDDHYIMTDDCTIIERKLR